MLKSILVLPLHEANHFLNKSATAKSSDIPDRRVAVQSAS